MVSSLRRNLRGSALFANLSLLVIMVICLIPFIWAVSSSLKGRDELFQTMPSLFPNTRPWATTSGSSPGGT